MSDDGHDSTSEWTPDGPYARRMLRRLPPLEERFGLCQWFHFEDYRLLEATVDLMDRLGVRHLRTGISWADYHRPGGIAWYDHQMETLQDAGLEILPCIWHTPPSITVEPSLGRAALPPREPRAFADFLDVVIDRWGDCFDHVELWNEPNNPYKWDRSFDPGYERFGRMVVDAGHWARQRGKVPVLGGMCLLDYDFLERMEELEVLDFVDVVGAHAFPGMWRPYASDWEHPSHWFGWSHRIDEVSRGTGDLPVWITETGLASRRNDDGGPLLEQQSARLKVALEAPAERVYWYTLFDLAPDRIAIEETAGGPREEAEYHMGLVRYNPGYEVEGFTKPAFHTLEGAFRQARRRQEEEVGGPSGVTATGRTRTSRSRTDARPADEHPPAPRPPA